MMIDAFMCEEFHIIAVKTCRKKIKSVFVLFCFLRLTLICFHSFIYIKKGEEIGLSRFRICLIRQIKSNKFLFIEQNMIPKFVSEGF